MGKFTITGFVGDQLTKLPPVVKTDLTGKTVMLIGANTGLGFEACKHFARMNPTRLIMACRSRFKGEAAVERLEKETGYKSAELWIIDLSQFQSVIAFADKFEKDGGRLDILVENAGCALGEYITTSDGWETTLQVNCLSLSLLALRLLPRMIQTGKEHSTRPRLVVVTSDVHFWSQIEKSVLAGKEIYQTLNTEEYSKFHMRERYYDTKLLNVFFFQELDELLHQTPVIVDGVNPGYCYSEFRRSLKGIKAALDWLLEKALARTTEEGSRTLVYAALGTENGDEDAFRGAYISSSKIAEPSDFVLSPEGKVVQRNLWNEMIGIFSKVDSRVESIARNYLPSSTRYKM